MNVCALFTRRKIKWCSQTGFLDLQLVSDRPEKKWNRFAGYSLLKKLGSIRNKTGLVSFYRAKQKYDAKGYFSTTWRSQVACKSNDI